MRLCLSREKGDHRRKKEGAGPFTMGQFRSRDELKKKIADLEDWAEVRKNICISCI